MDTKNLLLLEDLQKQINLISKQRGEAAAEIESLKIEIIKKNMQMGEDIIEGVDISRGYETLMRDKSKLDSLLASLPHIDNKLSDLRETHLSKMKELVSGKVDSSTKDIVDAFSQCLSMISDLSSFFETIDQKFTEMNEAAAAVGLSPESLPDGRRIRRLRQLWNVLFRYTVRLGTIEETYADVFEKRA